MLLRKQSHAWLLCESTKVLTVEAMKQRLRRMCARRKSGVVPGGEAAYAAYKDLSRRKELGRLMVDSGFNEARYPVLCMHVIRTICILALCSPPLPEEVRYCDTDDRDEGKGKVLENRGRMVHGAGDEGQAKLRSVAWRV